ncbi:MAG TPA: D-alanine--D-alanine ligase [Myxococcota bacterium]|nr:D-alanine--D-alanine ligase [Myxococcota bacterium]
MSKTVALLKGGWSPEREVSLTTGRACADALREAGFAVVDIDVTHDLRALVDALRPAGGGGPDVVFNALHGKWGEDGCVQGVLEILAIPYTHSGVLASALAMDKAMARKIFTDIGLRCAEGMVVERRTLLAGDPMPRPYVVKPIDQGSSVGVHIVGAGDNLAAVEEAEVQFGDRVLIERFVPGRELTVGVLQGRALAVGEIIPRHEIFDYECKYTPGMSQEIFPADLPASVAAECGRLGVLAHHALKLGGYSRVDFRLTPAGELFCLEVNTLPGMTATSLLPQSARAAGIEFPDLCERICRTARLSRLKEPS